MKASTYNKRGRLEGRVGMYAAGHVWAWDQSDPTRERASCACGVKTDVRDNRRIYDAGAGWTETLPPCPKATP